MNSWALKNISLLDAHSFIPDAALIVEQGKISYAGPFKDCDISAKFEDGRGRWITPGLINCHTHLAMSFLKDRAHGHENIIEDIFFKNEKRLSDESVYAFTFPSLMGSIQSGVTSFFDHYYFYESTKKACGEAGARLFSGPWLGDLGGAFPGRVKFQDAFDNQKWCFDPKSLHHPILIPHSANYVSKDYLFEMGEFAKQREIPIHLHLAQTEKENQDCLKQYGKTAVQFAKEVGLLGNKTLAIHLLAMSEGDAKTLRDTRTHIGLCPSSQIIYEELAPLELFKKYELKGLLGTDCAASHDSMDLMQELRTLYLMHQLKGAPLSPKEILKTVWDNPANWLGANLGRLKKNYQADLAFFQPGFECEPLHDPHLSFVMTLSSRHLTEVHVNGEAIYSTQKGFCFSPPKQLFKQEYQKLFT